MSIILMALILAVLAYALGFLQGGRFGWKSATLNAVKEYDSVYQEHEMRIAAANKLAEEWATKIRETANGRH